MKDELLGLKGCQRHHDIEEGTKMRSQGFFSIRGKGSMKDKEGRKVRVEVSLV